FDIEQLKRENSADDFKNLFMCEFVDDKASVFPFEELQRCMVDTLEEWEDYAPFAANPFGSRPVWIGYDPSHRGDSAGCVVLAPPVVAELGDDAGWHFYSQRNTDNSITFAV
ncbi:terminase large subunit domain-containing protein, partial [Escherichia sp. SS-MK2]